MMPPASSPDETPSRQLDREIPPLDDETCQPCSPLAPQARRLATRDAKWLSYEADVCFQSALKAILRGAEQVRGSAGARIHAAARRLGMPLGRERSPSGETP
jgi:hypothetical protein